jgi:DmsE family decaheme c-type cytochrome
MHLRLAVLAVAGVLIACALAAQTPPTFDIEECKSCHDEAVFTNYQHTYHATKVRESCAACHGDVAAHAKSELAGEGPGPVVSMRSLPPRAVNEKCLSCHDKGRQANWHGGTHDRRQVSCTSCHSVHFFKSQHSQLRTERESETCFTCHQQVRSMNLRTSHHPIREGKLDCGNCHDPHKNEKGLLKADSVNDLCQGCHADKRGPFLWEHAPVRENCTLCHQPHGSNHEKLLVAKMPWLCQRCHLNTRHPGSLYDVRNATVTGTSPSNRAVEHGCRNCHVQIHGTNSPSGPYLGR